MFSKNIARLKLEYKAGKEVKKVSRVISLEKGKGFREKMNYIKRGK